MESIMIGLGILLAIAIPIGVGRLAAGWLVARLWPSETVIITFFGKRTLNRFNY